MKTQQALRDKVFKGRDVSRHLSSNRDEYGGLRALVWGCHSRGDVFRVREPILLSILIDLNLTMFRILILFL